eukprot:gnl/Hemi2/1339_TR472_c0_g1_i1.p1 gnl/Hemi2/1339_TR472_c0_g1~~gnl/Hemi2/1339_TR472_c0_g1_i1.p1  ORF type:complete len:332 (-),score=97.50 gnl/Hemi2/1339_TR472_c0_g1_i1:144-1139(-)
MRRFVRYKNLPVNPETIVVSPLGDMINQFVHNIGGKLRSLGRSLDRFGLNLQPDGYPDKLDRSKRVLDMRNKPPVNVAKCSFVAPNATVTGDVTVGPFSSIFYSAVVRGDKQIRIGSHTTVQDRAFISSFGRKVTCTSIGNNVIVGAGAIIGGGATIQDGAWVGNGANIGEGAVLEVGCFVYPGSVVLPGTRVPSGKLFAGNPAAFVRDLVPEEVAYLKTLAQEQQALAEAHHDHHSQSLEERLYEQKVRSYAWKYNPDHTSQIYQYKQEFPNFISLDTALEEILPHRHTLPPYFRLQLHQRPTRLAPSADHPRPKVDLHVLAYPETPLVA